MSGVILKAIAKKTLKETAQKNINSQNPYEEEIPVYGHDGRPTGKVKTRKRAIPSDLSAHDATILKKVRRRAYRLDMSLFNCCGIRFGWSSVVGIIPVIGDFIDALMALNVVRTCAQIEGGLPSTLRSRMVFNILLDFGLGLVPFIGDLADAVFRANTRNAWLLETYLTKKAEAKKKGTITAEDGTTLAVPARPEVAKTADTSRGSFFSKFRQHDEEVGTQLTTNTRSNERTHGQSNNGYPMPGRAGTNASNGRHNEQRQGTVRV